MTIRSHLIEASSSSKAWHVPHGVVLASLKIPKESKLSCIFPSSRPRHPESRQGRPDVWHTDLRLGKRQGRGEKAVRLDASSFAVWLAHPIHSVSKHSRCIFNIPKSRDEQAIDLAPDVGTAIWA